MVLLAFLLMMVVAVVLGSVGGVLLHKWNTRKVSLDTAPMERKLAEYQAAEFAAEYVVRKKALDTYYSSLR